MIVAAKSSKRACFLFGWPNICYEEIVKNHKKDHFAVE